MIKIDIQCSFSHFLCLRSLILITDASETPSQLEKDAGFCSGGSEIGDDYQSDRIQNSPNSTDASEDSVDVKLSSIVIPTNKRKSFESIKCESDVPLKKRYKFETHFKHLTETSETFAQQNDDEKSTETFRTWIPSTYTTESYVPTEAKVFARHPGVTTLHRVPSDLSLDSHSQQDEPLALTVQKKSIDTKSITDHSTKQCVPQSNDKIVNAAPKSDRLKINESNVNLSKKSLVKCEPSTNSKSNSRPTSQRNYKNMTRERRIEANARERTRVHTISAAFDTLRQTIPSYSNTQKLSKLSILRVACAYILTLSRMTGDDYSADNSEPSIASCLEEITKTIQTEGKARKRKDD